MPSYDWLASGTFLRVLFVFVWSANPGGAPSWRPRFIYASDLFSRVGNCMVEVVVCHHVDVETFCSPWGSSLMPM
jgi:hypothetical protein